MAWGWGCSSVVESLPSFSQHPEFIPQHYKKKNFFFTALSDFSQKWDVETTLFLFHIQNKDDVRTGSYTLCCHQEKKFSRVAFIALHWEISALFGDF
jgi:hypothetical protein